MNALLLLTVIIILLGFSTIFTAAARQCHHHVDFSGVKKNPNPAGESESVADMNVGDFVLQVRSASPSHSTLRHLQERNRLRAISLRDGSNGVSWSSSGGGYVVRVTVGTPATDLLLTLDTGGDLSWMQCAPCFLCSIQLGPIFDPSSSSSFRQSSCNSPACHQLQTHNCQAGHCQFLITTSATSSRTTTTTSYGDLSTESFIFGSSRLDNITFGCSHASVSSSSTTSSGNVSAGILALGRSHLSFPSQVNGGIFSYCLPNLNSNNVGALFLSRSSFPAAAAITPLVIPVALDSDPTRLYVNLTGITIGNRSTIPVPVSQYYGSSSTGLLLVDSLTTITTLPIDVYTYMRNELLDLTLDIPLADATADADQLDTCYNMSGIIPLNYGNGDPILDPIFPTIVLHFAGGADLSLPFENTLLPDPGDGDIYCLAFSTPLYSAQPILGTIQLQGFHIGLDLQRSVLGLGSEQGFC